MKNIFKRCAITMLTGVLTSSLTVHADPSQGAAPNAPAEFPVLMHKTCPQVHFPDGYTAPVYYSGSCQTAYVLPSETIPLTQVIVTPVAGADASFCQIWDETKKTLSAQQNDVYAIAAQIAKDPENAASLSAANQQILQQMNEQVMRWKYFSALRVNVTVSTDQASQVNQFVAKNQADPTTQGLRFEAMPLYSSILAVGGSSEALGAKDLTCTDGICLGAIARVDFPDALAISTINGGTFSSDQFHVVMAGSAQGTFDVNMPTYCELAKVNPGQPITASQVLGLFPMKLVMQFPVQAGNSFKLSTSFDLQSMLKAMQNVTNTRYSRDEFYAKILNGDFGAVVNVTINDGPIPDATASLNQILAPSTPQHPTIYGAVGVLTNELISQFMDKLISELQNEKAITIDNDEMNKPTPEIAASQSTDQVGSQTVCSHDNGFFGIGGSTSCHTEGIYVTVNHDGVSTMAGNTSYSFNGSLDYNIQDTQTTELTSTSTFILAK